MTWLSEVLGSDMAATAALWLFGALGGWLGRNVFSKVSSDYLRGVLTRAYDEIRAAVLEVQQVYVTALKKGRADGTLTAEEAEEAKKLARDTAKANLGKKGLARLAKVLGLSGGALDSWMGNKIEATVSELKSGPR